MIHKFGSGSGRRFLTCPAVHPCEAVSPSTLITSLIDLAKAICHYKSRQQTLTTNKRNVTITIRHVSNLLVFLEEVKLQLGSSDLPDSARLCFSELHLIFQKIRCLLEDCTRDGASVFMLAKCERVANHFWVLTRAMATALDVLPLEFLDACGEAKEVVELFMRQARKVRFGVEFDDEIVLKNLMLILSKLENRIVPDRDELIRVLDYVRVRNWSGCIKEIKFLDSELGLEWLSIEKREVGILSSLIGFMCYCRCVIFEHVDCEANRQASVGSSSELLDDYVNVDDLQCPITLEIMSDPVTIATGHTYDRSSILKWFRAGNAICPRTGEKLSSMELIPNTVMKRLIEQYCTKNGIIIAESGRRSRDIKKTIVAGSPAAEGALRMVASFLGGKLGNGTDSEMNKAAYEIRILAKGSIFNRTCMVEAGTIPYLLKLLSSRNSSVQENAIAALLNLSKHSNSKAIIIENGGLRMIVDVLKKGLVVEGRQHAAAILFYLSSVDEYRRLIGEIPETIPVLVEMVRNETSRAKKNALVAIFGLLMHQSNHRRVLAAGAVPLLVANLKSSNKEDIVTDCLAVLSSLAEKSDGASAISVAGALHPIGGILRNSTSRLEKEYCATLLLALCINGGCEVIANLVKFPSLMESLYSLLSEGTSRASKKASALIGLLHEFSERTCSSSSSIFQQERFVHAW